MILYKGIAFDDLPDELSKTAETLNCNDAIPTSITLTPSPLEVRVGVSEQLTAAFEPANASPNVTWTSSNTSIATVDAQGNVTGVDEGTVTITATSSADNSVLGTATVNVVAFYAIPVTGVSVSPTSQNIFIGAPMQLEATVSPANADNQNVTWSSSNESIATVDGNGNITAISDGVVTITATTVEGSFTANSEITVGTLTEATITFDDVNKYKTTVYYAEGTMEVSVDYHAGTGNTVLSNGNNGISFRLRELNSGWQVQKDYLATDASAIGQESGTATASIPLTGATPTEDLPDGHFYFLFISFKTSDGDRQIKVNTRDIQVEAEDLSVSDFDLSMKINFYPNPVKDVLHIDGQGLKDEELMIYDVYGRIVLTKVLDKEQSINVGALASGMYFLHVAKGVAKFIKE